MARLRRGSERTCAAIGVKAGLAQGKISVRSFLCDWVFVRYDVYAVTQ
jgi:hypothetical protein